MPSRGWRILALAPATPSLPPLYGYLLHRAAKCDRIWLVIALRNTHSPMEPGMKHPLQHEDTCSLTFAELSFFFFFFFERELGAATLCFHFSLQSKINPKKAVFLC